VTAPLAGMFLQAKGLYWLFWVYALLMTFNLFVTPLQKGNLTLSESAKI